MRQQQARAPLLLLLLWVEVVLQLDRDLCRRDSSGGGVDRSAAR
jgi:hypothetical protein